MRRRDTSGRGERRALGEVFLNRREVCVALTQLALPGIVAFHSVDDVVDGAEAQRAFMAGSELGGHGTDDCFGAIVVSASDDDLGELCVAPTAYTVRDELVGSLGKELVVPELQVLPVLDELGFSARQPRSESSLRPPEVASCSRLLPAET